MTELRMQFKWNNLFERVQWRWLWWNYPISVFHWIIFEAKNRLNQFCMIEAWIRWKFRSLIEHVKYCRYFNVVAINEQKFWFVLTSSWKWTSVFQFLWFSFLNYSSSNVPFYLSTFYFCWVKMQYFSLELDL